MTGRPLAFAFACHLFACHGLLIEPNPARNSDTSSRKNSPLTRPDNGTRIIGGGPTDIEKFPYVVSLQQNGTFYGHDFEHFCVGNIIGEKWILTAAKCCVGKTPAEFHVRLGSDLYYEGGRVHQIESIEIHPDYDDFTWDYDVGLLKLSERITFNEKARPVELPKMGAAIESGTVLDIAGWGVTELLGMPSDRINRNTVPTIEQKDCRKIYAGDSVTDRMFCAFDGENGPCIGDTGSPAVSNGVLIGVASWSQSCAYMYPTAYARLPEMVDWIIEVTQDTERQPPAGGGRGTAATISGSVTLLMTLGIFATSDL